MKLHILGRILILTDKQYTMMVLLFLLFAVTMFLAWKGKRKPAVALFLINIALCALWFKHHATDHINIEL